MDCNSQNVSVIHERKVKFAFRDYDRLESR